MTQTGNVLLKRIWMYLIYCVSTESLIVMCRPLKGSCGADVWNTLLHCRSDYHSFTSHLHISRIYIVPREMSHWTIKGMLLDFMWAPSSGKVGHSASQEGGKDWMKLQSCDMNVNHSRSPFTILNQSNLCIALYGRLLGYVVSRDWSCWFQRVK